MLNKFMGIGFLGSDPEKRQTSSGQSVTNFSLAMSEKWKDKDGNDQSKTTWIKVLCWAKLADLCNDYLKKGSKVFVECKVQVRDWEDKNGQKRYATEFVAHTVQFLDSKSGSVNNGQSEATKAHNMAEHVFKKDPEFSDVPF